jgi:hypothetical protein
MALKQRRQLSPSPLVGEGGAQRRERGGFDRDENPPLALLRCAKLSLSHKGRG